MSRRRTNSGPPALLFPPTPLTTTVSNDSRLAQQREIEVEKIAAQYHEEWRAKRRQDAQMIYEEQQSEMDVRSADGNAHPGTPFLWSVSPPPQWKRMTQREFLEWCEKLRALKQRKRESSTPVDEELAEEDDEGKLEDIFEEGEYRFATGMFQPVEDITTNTTEGRSKAELVTRNRSKLGGSSFLDLSDDNVGSHWINIDIPYERLPKRWQDANRLPARELLEREDRARQKTNQQQQHGSAVAYAATAAVKTKATFQRLSRVRPGRWTRLEKIGSGATSVVHKGQDSRTGNIIAIKELRFKQVLINSSSSSGGSGSRDRLSSGDSAQPNVFFQSAKAKQHAKELRGMKREIELMSRLSHANVVQCKSPVI